uniref:Putative adenylate cyclase terminal-differentiation specific n=1 Tax=Anopheles darlingi TaxID=43151 RepID=A0A2M4CRB0_ANODA
MMAYQQYRVSQYRSPRRIDFDDPSTTKPPSLAKSAVLAALEEEERQKSRGTGLKRVAWPPPADAVEYEAHPSQRQQAVGQQFAPQQQQQQPQHQQQQQQQYYQQTIPQQQQQQPHPTYQPASAHQQQPGQRPVERIVPIQRPEDQQHQPLAAQYPNSPQQQQQQQPYTYQPQATQAFQPLTAQQPATAATAPSYQPIQPQYHQQQQQQQQQLPPTLVTTLRKEPPMSQEPAPVYQTQPVAAIYQGGSNMRGDQKWPPEEYKRQSEVDNEERRKLAQQPAFRPRRQQKDYADFFAKNALNNTYPGYRAPPGTQHHA